jgi:hypothetical protein
MKRDITQRLAMVMAAALAVGLFATDAVAAKEIHAGLPAKANQYYGLYQNPSQAIAPLAGDRTDFDHSGTRGREGRGGNPFHPEGPGNVTG